MNNKQAVLPIVNMQYIKDLSFESPNTPSSLTHKQSPEMNVKLDVQVQGFSEDVYEVCLLVNIEAKNDKEIAFIVEINYAGIFTVENAGDDLERILLVDCPTLLFPFARRIISNLSQDGGMPPLMLSPIDFMVLYERKQAEDASKK